MSGCPYGSDLERAELHGTAGTALAATPMSPRSPEQIVSGVAQLLAAHDPVVWRRLLAERTSDQTGHCPACRSTLIGTPTWPCTLRLVAEHAQRLSEVSAAASEQVPSGRSGPSSSGR